MKGRGRPVSRSLSCRRRSRRRPARSCRWGRCRCLRRRADGWWCSSLPPRVSSAVGVDARAFADAYVGRRVHRGAPSPGSRQPLGSMPEPWPARTWVMVVIVILRKRARRWDRSPSPARRGCWRACSSSCSSGFAGQPSGSMVWPWPAWTCVVVFIVRSRGQPSGSMVPPWPARTCVFVFIVRSCRQPSGSIAPPWAARMRVVVFIVSS
jgi:hypothetical protein